MILVFAATTSRLIAAFVNSLGPVIKMRHHVARFFKWFGAIYVVMGVGFIAWDATQGNPFNRTDLFAISLGVLTYARGIITSHEGGQDE